SLVVTAPGPARPVKAWKARPAVAPTPEASAAPAVARVATTGAPSAHLAPALAPVPAVHPAPQASPTPQANATPGTSYIEQMKAAGIANLRGHYLLGMKHRGITPESLTSIEE